MQEQSDGHAPPSPPPVVLPPPSPSPAWVQSEWLCSTWPSGQTRSGPQHTHAPVGTQPLLHSTRVGTAVGPAVEVGTSVGGGGASGFAGFEVAITGGGNVEQLLD